MLDLREYEDYFERKLKGISGIRLELSRKRVIRWSFNGLEEERYECEIRYTKHKDLKVRRRKKITIKGKRWISETVRKNVKEENTDIDVELAKELITKLIKKINTALLS